jgi:hypothetical protein
MPITKDIDRKKNLTVFKITGRVPFDDFRESILEYYKSGITDLVMFDLREAEGRGETFSNEQIFGLANFLENVREGRAKGKTALVATKDVVFGMCRMLEAYMSANKIIFRTFRTMDDAVKWIAEDREVN